MCMVISRGGETIIITKCLPLFALSLRGQGLIFSNTIVLISGLIIRVSLLFEQRKALMNRREDMFWDEAYFSKTGIIVSSSFLYVYGQEYDIAHDKEPVCPWIVYTHTLQSFYDKSLWIDHGFYILPFSKRTATIWILTGFWTEKDFSQLMNWKTSKKAGRQTVCGKKASSHLDGITTSLSTRTVMILWKVPRMSTLHC